MKQNSTIFYSILLVIGDFLALIGAFGFAYILRVEYDTRPLIEQIPPRTYLYGFLLVLPVWILIHSFIGLYRKEVYDYRFKEFGRLIVGSFIGMLAIIGYDFILDDTIFPARLVAVYGFVLSLSFLIFFRMFARVIRGLLFYTGYGVTNVLIVGDSEDAKSVIKELELTRRSGHKIVGVVTKNASKHPVFKTFDEAIEKLGPKQIHTIIQAELFRKNEQNDDVMNYAQTHHISYKFIPGNNELFVGNIEVELFRGTPMVTVHQTALIGWGKIVKRLFDLIVSGILIIIASPIMILVAIIEKVLEPQGDILLRQTRLTQYNKEFKAFKFRSHKIEYNGLSPEQAFEKMGRPDLAKQYRAGGDQLPEDPRISPLGKIIRATSIDELPQLFNVFLGDISLVGPRALMPQDLKNYSKKHHILSIKSGITGLAQVSGRRDISFEERRKLDLYYVQNWTFWLDITILLKTLRAVINGIGAK
jgi:exopolysaccharide biosynthesis polyprenyl glycosylphosphotransferase